MAITRLLLEVATENFTMGNYTSNFTDDIVSDIVSDIEIPYAEADDSGAVMFKAVGSFMLIFLSFFLR